MRKALALGTAAASVAGMAAFAAPVAAQTSGTTETTFALAGGGLAISVPVGTNASPVQIASGSTGAATLSGTYGTSVTVTDTRGALTAAWTTTVSSTDFVTGTATAGETATVTAARTVAKANIAYTSGAATVGANQVGTMTPSTGLSLAAPAAAGVWAGTGNNTVSWKPTLIFTLIPSQVAGTYRGIITHSVA